MEIRPSVPEDAFGVRQVHLNAFGGRPNEADLVDALWATGQAPISLVATADGQAVAHVLFSVVALQPDEPLENEDWDVRIVGLAPLAVLPTYQNQGIGTRLTEAGLTACREAGYEAVVVLGRPKFYRRFGFRRARDVGLGNEYGVDEAFMVFILDGDGWTGSPGTVRFSSAFTATGC